jgi:hypothetical protein
VLGISRNHAHALLSRARDQLATALGALVVARTGRQECPDLNAMLAEWDGALTVLVQARQPARGAVPGLLGAAAPGGLAGHAPGGGADRRAAADGGGLPGGFRDQVLRIATGNSPAAVAHRAAVAKTSYSFGLHGFPRALDQPGPPWWHVRPGAWPYDMDAAFMSREQHGSGIHALSARRAGMARGNPWLRKGLLGGTRLQRCERVGSRDVGQGAGGAEVGFQRPGGGDCGGAVG